MLRIFAVNPAGLPEPVRRLFEVMDQDPAATVGVGLVIFFFLALMARSRRGKRRGGGVAAGGSGFLDRQLLTLGDTIPFTGKMATEGVFCCAELGWGKTFLVFQRFLKAYVRAGMGGWILGAKGEDLEPVRRLFRALGAEGRLTIISPKHRNFTNWFEALASIAPPGSETEEVVGALTSLMEIESRSAAKSGGQDSHFFTTQAQLLLSAIITCSRLAGERITAENIYRFLVSLPQTAAQLADEGWKAASYANQSIGKAFGAAKTPREQADYNNATLYLLRELINLNDRTRSSIVSTVSAMLAKLLRGWMAEIWSSTTTARFQDAFAGRWFYIDTSPLEYGEYGVTSLVMAKHLAQRMIQRRPIDASSRPVALMFDEGQAIFVTADRDHQAVCRSKLGVSWVATQNMTGLYSVLGGGPAAEAQVRSWVALFGCKIFGANTDWTTNTYASELCGQRLESLMSGNMNQGAQTSTYEVLMGRCNDVSAGWSESYQPCVRPEHYVRLRKPEPPHHEADAVVIMPRLQQAIGSHFVQVTLRPDRG
jgi:hypothetical protein